MAYLPENHPNLLVDILRRKEFYSLKPSDYQQDKPGHKDHNILPQHNIKNLLRKHGHLQPRSYQLYVKNFLNPNTPYSKLFIKWETGVGKTIAALLIAMNFISYYQKEQEKKSPEIGSVFVLGFSGRIFKRELLRFPEFGFVSRDELEHLKKLKRLAINGGEHEMNMLHDMNIKLRKRLSNRKGNGFFKFFGYKEFVNKIFIFDEARININKMSESEILAAVKNREIMLDKDLMDQFKNSLLICDEIHNVYNSLNKNNWGIAIQSVLDYHPSIRAVFLSATPINNSPTEVVDLLNLLLPYGHPKVLKSDIFEGNNLKKGAMDKLTKWFMGRISFLRDANPKHYPERVILGESIPGVDYLKFVRSPMSPLHFNTYNAVFTGTLTQESQYLNDFVMPNPKNKGIGLYQSSQIKQELTNASREWKDSMHINLIDGKIVGDITKRDKLEIYSAKYARMIDDLRRIVKTGWGKCFIYHNTVIMSGVNFIREILLKNGFTSEAGNSTQDTLCSICGKERKHHTKAQLEATGGSDNAPSITRINGYLLDYRYDNADNPHGIIYRENDISYIMSGTGLPSRAGDTGDKKTPYMEYHIDGILKYIDETQFVVDKDTSIVLQYLSSPVLVRTVEDYDDLMASLGFVCDMETQNDRLFHFYYKGTKEDAKILSRVIGGRKRKKSNPAPHTTPDPAPHTTLNPAPDHLFMPCRFIVASTSVEKSVLDRSIEKFNNPDNSDGRYFMILLGSRIIKESYDIKAIQNILVMSRPDNIPTFIQIIGRGIRQNSHQFLPPEKRKVYVRIYTHCLPVKEKIESRTGKSWTYKLSHEEERYKDKILQYHVIQDIEKIMHMNAIDSVVNRRIIWKENDKSVHGKLKHLRIRQYDPNVPRHLWDKIFKPGELIHQTFDAYHVLDEIDQIIYIIKRLFIESSTIWTYNDLWKKIQSPSFHVEYNTEYFQEDNFIIALNRVIYHETGSVDIVLSEHEDLVDKLNNPDDKIIMTPNPELHGGFQNNVVVHLADFYILVPYKDGKPIIDTDVCYRGLSKKKKYNINIRRYLETKSIEYDYEEKVEKFFRRWENVAIEDLEMSICDYGKDFHQKFIESVIEYVFHVWTGDKVKKHPFHNFYFKMLYYYDIVGLVLWANTIRQDVFRGQNSPYKDLVDEKHYIRDILQKKDKKLDPALRTSGVIQHLYSSIKTPTWIPKEAEAHYIAALNRSLELFGHGASVKQFRSKPPIDVVPVAHVMGEIPRFYHPKDGWINKPGYADSEQNFRENNILIGYDEKSKTGIHIRFKIRSPIQNIKQYRDTRMIEKGSVCRTKSKQYLKDIAKKLGIVLKEKNNVVNICSEIRTKLIYNEIKERMNKTKIKWFYFHYEKRPETIQI